MRQLIKNFFIEVILFIKTIKFIKGSSMIEVMVGSAILGIVAVQVLKKTSSMVVYDKKIRKDIAMEKIAMNMYNNIDSNFKYHQIDFSPNKFEDKTEMYSMAWNDKGIFPKKDCPDCQGKAGFIITPLLKYRGLYVLIVRIAHSDLLLGHKDYTFLISGN